ncbi:putative signal peptide protein [Rubrivivax sp. A210]|uniref:YceI family protein n=1 Tax=Rubrivivax sp. A210 TaxID=2772301 RepID=UPI0019184A7F|nr:YceI family protein [Rubrivivax sp. A210]CAD5374983.1 putative signal peptide protein [Rubrivivax sp. A210]
MNTSFRTVFRHLPLALLTAATLAQAQPKQAQLNAAGSEIAFITRQMGVPVEGKFGKFAAQIALDPKKPETGSVSFSIETGSARFGSPDVDVEVPKPTWLNVAKFPQASFQSSAIKAAGPGKFEVAGKLSIKGSTRDIVVPVQLTQSGATSTASGAFTIKRLDFKVGDGDWADTSMLANDIQVRFKLQLGGLGPL